MPRERKVPSPRKSLGGSQGSLLDFFPRRASQSLPSSSQPGPSQVRSPTKAAGPSASSRPRKKANTPARPAQEVIVISTSSDATHITISSDSPSHISISSDSSVPRARAPMQLSRRSGPGAAPAPRLTLKPHEHLVTSTPAKTTYLPASLPPLPPMSQLRNRSHSVVKSRPSPKRVFELEDDSDEGKPLEHYRVPRKVPTSSKEFFSPKKTSKASARKRALAPRDNVLVSTAKGDIARSGRKPTPTKRARLDDHVVYTLSSGNEADMEELIPSSQSDEQELSIAKIVKKNPAEVKESIDKWRKETCVGASDPECAPLKSESLEHGGDSKHDIDMAMDVDVSQVDDSALAGRENLSLQSEAEVSAQLFTPVDSPDGRAALSTAISLPASPARKLRSDSPLFTAPLTPPRSSQPPSLPPTPAALDADSKAAKIIAEIRANAYKAVTSSPEEALRELSELSDSSDESDDDIMAMLNKDKDNSKTSASVPSESTLSDLDGSCDSEAESEPRYNMRRRDPSSNEDSKLPSLYATFTEEKRKPRRKSDPLDALLKEKNQADKHGRGINALRAAEAALASSSRTKETVKFESDDEDPFISPRAHEKVAHVPIEESPGLEHKSHEGDGYESTSEDEQLQEGEYERILGEEGGKAVGDILAKDRRLKMTAKQKKNQKKGRILGVPFWDTHLPDDGDEAMEADSIPPLPFDQVEASEHPFLSSLFQAVHGNDVELLLSLLVPHFLVCLEQPHLQRIVPWLFLLVTSSGDSPYSESAYNSLLQIAASVPIALATSVSLSFSIILDTLIRLGASESVIKAMDWSSEARPLSQIDGQCRVALVHRLLDLVATFAQRSALLVNDVPDIMWSLLLVGLDPVTSPELSREIMVVVESVGRSIPSGDHVPFSVEAVACCKIVRSAKTFTPMNQAHLLSHLIGGCPQTNRMARIIARCFLLDEEPPSTETYCKYPSLLPIVSLLSPPSGSEAIFDIQGNADNDDYYEDLVCYLDILGKALTDIEGYILLEKQQRSEQDSPVKDRGSPTKERPATPLEQIRISLDSLHGKIVDTRAAHLDRSRAKAALQRLSFRVHYQRMAALRSGPGTGKPRNLHGYFGQPRN
ncbi:uncharacterized protein LAESUDRAFT_755664 [Laetiporus sulphureus 93-53]|uniref:Uncharacterized protein n=1 Tax=Laetiporus sulphureus 93-53 TaxID=1314785 RepID=A0A165GZK0_9APHY|nr:uncharacterized protein LAESUDRAFT_755664 [Laetiporus sulphureus 93-53]KZT11044.1 hypothetical protein LAESUDRAFT_755664 [Laetiporus sulphureus 93-53]